MKQIKNFRHEMFGDLTVYGTSNQPMFQAGEVAMKLWTPRLDRNTPRADMNKLRNALIINDGAEPRTLTKDDFITEKQLYKAMFKSNSTHAEDFQDWVTDIVLPTIRRTGGFVSEGSSVEFIKTYFPSLNETEVAFMSKQLEENRKLQQKITEQSGEIDDLVDNFKPGLTLTQAILQFNGVKQKGLIAHLIAKKKIKMHTKTWVETGGKLFLKTGYLPTGITRDWFQTDFVESSEPVGKTRSKVWYYRQESILTLTKVGVDKLYRMYKAGKLPMKADWDGEYKFTK